PRSIQHIYSFSNYESAHANLSMGMWARILGIPHTSVKGQMCAIHYGIMYMADGAPSGMYDALYSEYVVLLGKSVGYDTGYAGGDARNFAEMCRHGRKFVVVGPRATMEATRGEWVSCKPNTELALVYAWLHVMLREMDRGYDEAFLKKNTNGVYLIGPDGDYVRGEDGKPQIWDAADGTAKSFDDETLTDPALFGRYTVNDVVCVPAFSLLVDSVASYTPEWASQITTVPAEKIRDIAHNLVEHAHIGSTIEIEGQVMPLRPSCVLIGRGTSNQETGTLIDLWSRMINVLLGNVGFPGGLQTTLMANYTINAEGTVEPYAEAATVTAPPSWPPQHLDLTDYWPHAHSNQTFIWHVLDDKKRYGIEFEQAVLFSSGANPVAGSDDPELVCRGLRQFGFVIYHGCYHMDEMAMMSDLLLPEHANLECHTVHLFPGNENTATAFNEGYNASNHAVVVRKGIKPLYNTKDGNDILLEMFGLMGVTPYINSLANALGSIGFISMNANPAAYPKGGLLFKDPAYMLDPMKQYTAEEMFDLNLKSAFGPDKGLDYLDKVKFIPYTHVEGAELYATNRPVNRNVRFQLYPVSQLRSGKCLVDALESFPVDMADIMKVPMDVLRHRFDPVPYYPTNLVIDNEPAEFDLRCCLYRHPVFMFRLSSMDQDPVRRDYSKRFLPDDNGILMHPDTAAARGIAQGDRVHIQSPYGETWGNAVLTQTIRPDTVAIGGARGRHTSRMGKDLLNDVNFNDIFSGDIGHTDPVDGATINCVSVKITKA
ncbi:MAG: molybdopterin-dependent oxidoreductase, partial [Eggerthellaceae bacterium]|nr:molybdopterin-dependent oxidoreductase [Eggerthellaceae bacterium]